MRREVSLLSSPLHLGATCSGKHLTILWFCLFAPTASSLFCQHLLILQDPGRITSPRMASQMPYLSQLLSLRIEHREPCPGRASSTLPCLFFFFFFCRQKTHTAAYVLAFLSLCHAHTHTHTHTHTQASQYIQMALNNKNSFSLVIF